jgi:hypothetical protein
MTKRDINNMKTEMTILKHEISTFKQLNSNYIVEIDKKNDENRRLEDKMKIDKGDFVKESKNQKLEYDEKVRKIKIKMVEAKDNSASYKKYTDAELDVMKNINDRLKNYINILKKELVFGNDICF